ncbi:MAG: hypothetical protein NXI22_04690, partial [bacterium]|nr:hypothetical protein [bacterium]
MPDTSIYRIYIDAGTTWTLGIAYLLENQDGILNNLQIVTNNQFSIIGLNETPKAFSIGGVHSPDDGASLAFYDKISEVDNQETYESMRGDEQLNFNFHKRHIKKCHCVFTSVKRFSFLAGPISSSRGNVGSKRATAEGVFGWQKMKPCFICFDINKILPASIPLGLSTNSSYLTSDDLHLVFNEPTGGELDKFAEVWQAHCSSFLK